MTIHSEGISMLLPRGSPVNFRERIDDDLRSRLLRCRDRDSVVEGLI